MFFNFNKYSLNLGEVTNYINQLSFEMKTDTSYLEKFIKKFTTSKAYRTSLLPLKLQALLNIKESIAGKYSSYQELLAGMGMSAKIFGEGLELGKLELSDLSKECFEILKLNFPGENVQKRDMFNFPLTASYKSDFAFLDFNNCTIKRFTTEYKDVIKNTFQQTNKFVLINDCSVFYLKYGAGSYKNYGNLMGLELDGTKQDFYKKSKVFYKTLYPEWSLVEVQAFKDTSFLLFKKGDWDSLKTTVLTNEDVKEFKVELK